MTTTVRINVVLPVYNAQNTIVRAITSVLDQKGVMPYLCIVDHGSTDKTRDRLAPFEQLDNVSILYLQRSPHDRRSAAHPLNVGAQSLLEGKRDLRHEWFMRLDSDDFLCQQESLRSLTEELCDKQLKIGRIMFFDGVIGSLDSFTVAEGCRDLATLRKYSAYSIPHHAGIIRLDLLSRILQKRGFIYDERIAYGEDLELTLSLLAECRSNQVSFTDVDVCFKQLDGFTISRTSSLWSVACDHLRIFKRHDWLFSRVSLRTFCDLALQGVGSAENPLRTVLGFPGKRWARIAPEPQAILLTRLNQLS